MTPLKYANGNRPLTKEEKELVIKDAAEKYGMFMRSLGFDWENDPNSSDTPMRVAKAFVNDLAEGVYNESPRITAFDNIDGYDGMVFEGNIKLHSLCSHHHLPFVGVAHVAYIPTPKGKVIGLSKLNRIVEFYAHRPQVQENLTMQIHDHIDKVCKDSLGVAVVVSAEHLCTCVRGIRHDSTMKTAKLSGAFMESDNDARKEFYNFIRDLK